MNKHEDTAAAQGADEPLGVGAQCTDLQGLNSILDRDGPDIMMVSLLINIGNLIILEGGAS